MVFSGLTAACRRARLPTSRSPVLVKATTDGVVREPSALGITTGSPPSIEAVTELVVPRSIPTVFGMRLSPRAVAVGPGAKPGMGTQQHCSLPKADSSRVGDPDSKQCAKSDAPRPSKRRPLAVV